MDEEYSSTALLLATACGVANVSSSSSRNVSVHIIFMTIVSLRTVDVDVVEDNNYGSLQVKMWMRTPQTQQQPKQRYMYATGLLLQLSIQLARKERAILMVVLNLPSQFSSIHDD